MSLLNNIIHFTEGNFNYLTKSTLPQHVREQIILRQVLCSKCLEDGKCSHCGCKTPQMFYASSKIDKLNKWGPFLSEVQWNALTSNIDAYTTIIQEIIRLRSLPAGSAEGIPSQESE